jgi:tetratricopeptide (TPR) repeat protein
VHKRSLLLLLFPLLLFGIEIDLREGKEKGQVYSTLNLKSRELVNCVKKFDDFERISEIVCRFPTPYGKRVKEFSNSFFDVEVKRQGKITDLIIRPRFKSVLFSSDHDLITIEQFVRRTEKEFARHWLVVGYNSEKIPFLEGLNRYTPRRINFPVELSYKKVPFIGALDINGQPIPDGTTEDVEMYMELRTLYEDGKYRDVINLSNEILQRFPNTLFVSEIVLHQIRALFKLKAYKKIVNISKEFLRNFSSDVAVPEVLLYTAYVHSKLGFIAYAKYYFERLFNEHLDSEYRNMGFVYYGDARIHVGKKAEGIRYYKRALFNTKDRLIATKAAYRLGNLYLEDLKPEESAKYFAKVVTGNPKYFNLSVPRNYELAERLASFEEYKVASDIMKILLKDRDPHETDRYEVMLKDMGVWLDEAEEVEDAYFAYSKYLGIYNYGTYDSLIRENQDKLLFKRDEANQTKIFENYTTLIKTYGLDSDIGKQAIYEKGKLLHKLKEFQMVLQIEKDMRVAEPKYPEIGDIIVDSAKELATSFVQTSRCEESIELVDKYTLTLPESVDTEVYYCAVEGGKYPLAEEIARRNIQIGKDTLDWVYRYSQVLIRSGRYHEFIPVSDEVLSLMENDKSDKHLDIYFDRFKAFNILKRDDEVLQTVDKLEKHFKDTYRNLQPFKSAVEIGKKRRDNLLIERYASRVIEIQNKLNSFVESPDIEFLLNVALKEQGKHQRSIQIMNGLLTREPALEPDDVARAYYELGIAYIELGNDSKAKDSFEKSSKASPTNVWGKLSSEYLDIFN